MGAIELNKSWLAKKKKKSTKKSANMIKKIKEKY